MQRHLKLEDVFIQIDALHPQHYWFLVHTDILEDFHVFCPPPFENTVECQEDQTKVLPELPLEHLEHLSMPGD
jgi:hypothetical protein